MTEISPFFFIFLQVIIIDSTDIDLSIGLASNLHLYKRLLKPRLRRCEATIRACARLNAALAAATAAALEMAARRLAAFTATFLR